MRLSTSSGTTKAADGAVSTGIIDLSTYAYPVTIRTRGVDFSQNENRCAFAFLTADGSVQASGYLSGATGAWGSLSFDSDGNLTMSVTDSSYNRIRICGIGSGANLIVTVNEEIN